VNRALGATVWLGAGTKRKRGQQGLSPRRRRRQEGIDDDGGVKMAAGAIPASSAMNYESIEGSRKGKMVPGCSIPCGGARQRVDSVSEATEKLDPCSATQARF
jgi:hypothetical protein